MKIKGLGIFKLIGVNSCESVNVNMGECIKIEGYIKIFFIFDFFLRDIINRFFLYFEIVVLNENIVLEDMLIEELEEELGNIFEIIEFLLIIEIIEREEVKVEEKVVEIEVNGKVELEILKG